MQATVQVSTCFRRALLFYASCIISDLLCDIALVVHDVFILYSTFGENKYFVIMKSNASN